LIEGAEEANRIAREHRGERRTTATFSETNSLYSGLGTVTSVETRTDLTDIPVLGLGEVAIIDQPGAILGPSDLKNVRTRLV